MQNEYLNIYLFVCFNIAFLIIFGELCWKSLFLYNDLCTLAAT